MEIREIRNYDAEKVGVRIKKIRKAYGETQMQLAEYLGLSKETIFAMEKWKQTCMPDHIGRICDHYHVTADYLYYGIENGSAMCDSMQDETGRIMAMLRNCSHEDLEKAEQMLKLFLRK